MFASVILLSLTFFQMSLSQGHSVSGTVRDGSTNEPLPFANISVKGQRAGTVTDANGSYRLPLKPGSYELVISFVGYRTETKQIQVEGNDKALPITLFPTDILLQEVTVYSSAPGQTVQTEVSSLTLPSERLVEVTSVIPDVFRSGMSANIRIIVQEKRNALLLPLRAVLSRRGRTGVLQRSEERGVRPHFRPVKTGLQDEGNVEIVEGLTDSSVVLLPDSTFVLPKNSGGSNPFSPQRNRRRE